MFTVFTPTYNRAYLLPRLYQSLCEQVFTHFEWLIVDDGSTDETEELIRNYSEEQKITIRYFKQPNGGKHRAINRGVKESFGEWFFIVDSDDFLFPKTLMRLNYYSKQIENNADFAGVCGLKVYPDLKGTIGKVGFHILDMNSILLRETYGIKGDMAEMFRTSILRKYKFPEFDGERFLSESVVWNRIAHQYKLRYFNEPIYICDYLSDGLTKSIRKHHRESPLGTMLFYNEQLRSRKFGVMTKIKAAINYWRYTINFPMSARKEEFRPVWWSFIFFPLGVWFYKNDLKK